MVTKIPYWSFLKLLPSLLLLPKFKGCFFFVVVVVVVVNILLLLSS